MHVVLKHDIILDGLRTLFKAFAVILGRVIFNNTPLPQFGLSNVIVVLSSSRYCLECLKQTTS